MLLRRILRNTAKDDQEQLDNIVEKRLDEVKFDLV